MNKHSRQGHVKNALQWFVCASLAFYLAVAASWWVNSLVDYGYPLWYQMLSIDQHISRYAPKHPSKRDFAQLSAQQHKQAFAQIVSAIHGRGEVLEQIDYQAPGRSKETLLDELEIRHLHDVARLLRMGGWATLAAFLLWLGLMKQQHARTLPGYRQRMLTVLVVALLSAAVLLLAGPKAVFYQLHVWLFPVENPWFFYWEESLMSTLMKAPVLFGAIAGQILLLALLLVLPIQLAGRWFFAVLSRR
jgi:hypothetical protein